MGWRRTAQCCSISTSKADPRHWKERQGLQDCPGHVPSRQGNSPEGERPAQVCQRSRSGTKSSWQGETVCTPSAESEVKKVKKSCDIEQFVIFFCYHHDLCNGYCACVTINCHSLVSGFFLSNLKPENVYTL